jgi:hypothetical protein
VYKLCENVKLIKLWRMSVDVSARVVDEVDNFDNIKNNSRANLKDCVGAGAVAGLNGRRRKMRSRIFI